MSRESKRIVVYLLEVGIVVQRQQPQKLRESFDLLWDALSGPILGEHAHRDSEHRGPAMEENRPREGI